MEQAMKAAPDLEKEERERHRAAILEQVRHLAMAGKSTVISGEKSAEEDAKAGLDLGKDWPFVPALMAAVLKDLFDLIIIAAKGATTAAAVVTFGITSGLVAAVIAFGWIISILAGIFIAMMLFLQGAGEKSKLAKSMIKRLGVLGAGVLAETFFEGLNVFPIETLTVLVIVGMTIAERKNIKPLAALKNSSLFR